MSAAIRLLTGEGLERGEYRIDVGDDYINIYMHEETRRYVEFLRQSDMRVLFQSVYMVALTHAIQDIEPDDNRKWAEALRKDTGRQ